MTSRRTALEAEGFRPIARQEEVAAGRPFAARWGDRHLVLYRVHDRYYATEGTCPHAAGPLSSGDLEGFEIVCPLHGWSFDVRDGRCTNVAGMDIDSFALELDDGEILVRVDD